MYVPRVVVYVPRVVVYVPRVVVYVYKHRFHQDPNWSETGDRYLLKLFRDYLFHQITPSGTPWLDLAHIVQSLNKLDAGSQERICLYSREGETVLIVSFAELRHCLEVAFSEVLNSSTTASSTQEGDYL